MYNFASIRVIAKTVALVIILGMLGASQQQGRPNVTIANPIVLSNQQDTIIMRAGVLNQKYDDTVYNQVLNCKNGNLNIINKTNGSSLVLLYSGLVLDSTNSFVSVTPNQAPLPSISFTTPNTLTIDFDCPENATNSDYFNKVDVQLTPDYRFSFLLDCDPDKRHKNFQMGYLIIAGLDAAILIGVAMHSRVWSLKWGGLRLRLNLRWYYALTACFVAVICIAALYFFAFKDFDSAFKTVRYVGIGLSAPFLFLCFNQVFFLFRRCRRNIYKKMRYCDLVSMCLSAIVVVTCVFFQNWILYNLVATCICVACIKLFHFRSLKEAYIFMGIVVLTITIIAIISHYVLDRSYNDYATQLSSPLFLSVPDLVNNLYKQCSWLPVVDVIIPGSVLSYLRLYDENRSSRYGGVYTIWGNLTFISSTILWVGIEALYPFSVPFCLVTYSCLMLVVFLFAWRRNEVGTLFRGNFMQDTSVIEESRLEEKRQSFTDLVDQNLIKPLRKSGISQSSGGNSNNEEK